MSDFPVHIDPAAAELGPDARVIATGDFSAHWMKKQEKLRRQYRELCETPSDIYLHLPRFVALVGSLNAQHVIELGSRSGVSTVAWLYGLAITGGRLTSVDLDPAPEVGSWSHWRHIQGDDLSMNVLGQLDGADIVFIDTSHHYEQTVKELHVYRWLVKPGGVIVCHDTELPIPEGAPPHPRFPVKKAVVEFCEAEGFDVKFYEDCWGLAVIKVR